MTISEASKKWEIKSKTILSYIEKGLISNLYAQDNTIYLPDINKPFVVSPRAGNTLENIYKYILTACNQQQYIDNHLFGKFNMSDTDFKKYIEILENEKYIKRNEDYQDSYSNIGFEILPNGNELLNKLKKGSKNPLTVNLINIKK